MGNARVSYLAGADRRCRDCNCTKAVPDRVARVDPALAVVATRECGDCGDRVEVDTSMLDSAAPLPAGCDDCGALGDHARAEVELPEGLGKGYVLLCDDCIAIYDEAQQAWAG